MKKLYALLVLLVAFSLVGIKQAVDLNNNPIQISAQSAVDDVVSVTNTQAISSDVTIENKTIFVPSDSNIDAIFEIANGATLTLKNVTFQNEGSVNNCYIYNCGKVVIDNVVFDSANNVCDILNDSDMVDCVNLLKITSDQNVKITLKKNAVYVNENSVIEGLVTLKLYDLTYADLNSSDNYIGKVLVKGNNTFAGMYLDCFKFDGAPNEASLKDKTNKDKYFQDFIGNYYIDYAGVLGDSLSNANDGIEVSYGKNLEDTNTIDSGDIILTKFSMKAKISKTMQINGCDAVDMLTMFAEDIGEDEYIYAYIGGKYATSRLFAQGLLDMGLPNCILQGGVGVVNQTSNKYYKIEEFALDNAHSLLPKNNNDYSCVGVVDFEEFEINVDIDNEISQEYFYASLRGKIEGSDYLSNYLWIISLNGKSVQVDLSSCLNVCTIVDNANFRLLQLEMPSAMDSVSISVFMQSESVITAVQTYVDVDSVEYSGVDYMLDNRFKPYYLDGENKIYLESTEYRLCKVIGDSEISCTQIIDVGNYNIYLESASDVVYAQNSHLIAITPRYLDITFGEKNFEYDGTVHSVSVEATNVLDGDEINLDIVNNENIRPGNYTISIDIDSSSKSANNYVLRNEDKNCNVYIDRGVLKRERITLDTQVIDGVDTKVTTYNGKAQTIKMIGSIEGVTTLSCMSYTDAGTYTCYPDFVIDTSLYKSVEKFAVKLVINKQILYHLDDVEIPDIYHTYNGESIKVQVSSDILNGLPEQFERRVSITGDNVSEASSTPYDVQIKFFIKEMYAKNYAINNDTKIVQIHIAQAKFDIALFKFKDKTVEFDGEGHTIDFCNDYQEIVTATMTTVEAVSCGTHTFVLQLTQVDIINYEPLPASISAILTITQKVLDTSYLQFKDRTFTYDKDNDFKMEVTGLEHYDLSVSYTYYLDDKEVQFVDVATTGAGKYRVVATFTSSDIIGGNIAHVPDMQAYLTINKQEIDFNLIVFKNQDFIYDKNVHMINEVSCPYNIDFTYSTTGEKEVGTYIVEAYPNIDEKNYTIKNARDILATMKIVKAKYDMSGIKFNGLSVTYDGLQKSVKIQGKLPTGVTCTYVNNEQINAGRYVAVAHFEGDEDNYDKISDMQCIIEISPKKVDVKLAEDTFVYTGNVIELNVVIVGGVLEGDNCQGVALNNKAVDYGSYTTQIQLNNDNYTPAKSNFSFSIKKADVDMSQVTFEDVCVTYDGNEHTPQLIGVIPSGIVPNYVMGKMVNAGEYVVYVDFSTINNNYNKPNRLTAKVTIKKKPILVEFSGYTGVIEDGNRKDIGVNFIGLVDNNFDGYKKVYSKEPITAGKYTLTVQLNDNSNYEILGVSSLVFEILTNSKSYKDDTFQMQIAGDGFSQNSEVNIVNVDKDINEQLAKEGIDSKAYKSFKIEMTNIEGVKNISVTLKTNSLNLTNGENIKLFKIQDGGLKQIECKVYNGQIVFDAIVGDEIVIVEENEKVNSRAIYIAIACSVVLVSLIAIVLIVIKKKRRKEVKFFIEDK